jgi:hypothetical protein
LWVNKKQYIDEVEQEGREYLKVREKMKNGWKREYNGSREMEVHRSPKDTAPCSLY